MGKRARSRLSRAEVFNTEHVPLGVSRYKLNGTHAAHSHDFVEVAVVLSGSGIHHTAQGAQVVQAGDAFVLCPGSWHAYAECRQLEVYNCCFGTELLQRELGWVLEDPLAGYLFGAGPLASAGVGIVALRLPATALDGCREHLNVLREAAQADPNGSRVDQMGHLLLMLGVLARSAAHDVAAGNRFRRHPAVLRAAELMNAQLDRRWVLGELAREVCLDPSYLVRLFKAGTGLPPLAYLAHLRLERAAYLLLSTNAPVAELGAIVGWPDPNYFARRFRAHFGTSPSAYRARFLDGDEAAG